VSDTHDRDIRAARKRAEAELRQAAPTDEAAEAIRLHLLTIHRERAREEELAALEREIGRAMIGIEMLTNMHYADPYNDLIYEARDAAYLHRLNLITRYRALLAAGGEES